MCGGACVSLGMRVFMCVRVLRSICLFVHAWEFVRACVYVWCCCLCVSMCLRVYVCKFACVVCVLTCVH